MLTVVEGSPHDAIALLHESVAYIRSLYPEEHAHTFKLHELTSNGSRFFIAWHGDQLMGCSAYVWHTPCQIEIKHMFVVPASRGLGCGRALLAAIEHHAILDKAHRIVLETSRKQHAAIALYRSCGYHPCEPYTEHHAEDVFMMKLLDGR